MNSESICYRLAVQLAALLALCGVFGAKAGDVALEPQLRLPENLRPGAGVQLINLTQVPLQEAKGFGIKLEDSADLGRIAEKLKERNLSFEWTASSTENGGIVGLKDAGRVDVAQLLKDFKRDQICTNCQTIPGIGVPDFPRNNLTQNLPSRDSGRPLQGGWLKPDPPMDKCSVPEPLEKAILEFVEKQAKNNSVLNAMLKTEFSCKSDRLITIINVLSSLETPQ